MSPMSEQTTPPRGRLREHVAEEIRVLLARRRMSGAELARRTGIKQSTMSRRMTGETAFDTDDIEAIAEVLGIDVAELFPHSEGRSSQDFDLAPAERTATVGHSSVGLAKGATTTPQPRHITPPTGRARAERARPVSAVPARKRRPRPVLIGNRAQAK